MKRRSIVCFCILAVAVVTRAAELRWPDDVREQMVGGIVDGRYGMPPRMLMTFPISNDGGVCMIIPTGDEAVLFPTLSTVAVDGAIHQKVGARPSAIVFKQVGTHGYQRRDISGNASVDLIG